jgi:hypothetical protein
MSVSMESVSLCVGMFFVLACFYQGYTRGVFGTFARYPRPYMTVTFH